MSRSRPRKLSRKGARFICSFEGFRSCAYRDPVGIWTIGYGTTGPEARPGRCISRRKARRYLRKDASALVPVILEAAPVGFHLRQHELDALVSAGYNLGPGLFDRGRSMGDALRAGNRQRIAAAFGLYVYAGEQKLAGLVRRRKAERRVFLKGYRK